MAQVTLKGKPISTSGDLPRVGSLAPAFTLTSAQLGKVSLSDFAGKKVVVSIFPSIDTGTCATSTRKFNEQAAGKDNVTVITVSEDLPFALGRFCGAEGIDNVHALSAFKTDFAKQYGVELTAGPLMGLCARSVVVINEQGQVVYNELVSEITEEPNYEAAMNALN